MNHEARIGYLCYQAATGRLTPEECSELLGFGALDPEIFLLIELEKRLAARRKR